MKKQISLAVAVLFTAGIIVMSGCKKDDTTPPVITITGSSTIYSILNVAYTDAGAKATDNKDGDVTSKITVSGTVNKDLTGTYTLTYSVLDAAGNTGTATRSVIVYNAASFQLSTTYLSSGVSYTTKDSVVGAPPTITFPQTVTFSSTVNNRIVFSYFADYSNNTTIYADIVGTSITLNSQTVTNIGSVPTDTHIFSGTGTITGTKFTLHFSDNNTTQSAVADDYEWFN